MDKRLSKLEALIGTWSTTITMINEDGSDGTVSYATDIYRWAASKAFVLHDVDAQMNGERMQSLEIIAPDPLSAGFAVRAYEPDGSFADYHAELDGKTWSIEGEALKFLGTFSDDGMTLTGRWEQKRGVEWQALMRVSLQKAG